MSDDLYDVSDWGSSTAPAPRADVTGEVKAADDDLYDVSDWSNADELSKQAKTGGGMSWTDMVKQHTAEQVGFGAALATTGQRAAEKAGWQGAAEYLGGTSADLQSLEEEVTQSISPDARKAREAALIKTDPHQERLFSHPLRELGMKGAGIATPMEVGALGGMAGAILGMVGGPAGMAAGATAGTAAAGAGYGVVQGLHSAIGWTNKLDDATLAKEAPVFGQFKEMYLSQGKAERDASYAARADLHEMLYGLGQMAMDAGTNAVMFGAGQKLIKGAFGEKALTDYALTGGSMAAGSAAGDINRQTVENVKKGTEGYDIGSVIVSALNGGVEGLSFHGLTHSAHALRSYLAGKEPDSTKRDTSADLFKEKQAVNEPAAGAASTGVAPKQTTATTQPPPNESAQAGEIGNTTNPPTRDQDPTTGKEAAAGAKGEAAKQTGKQRDTAAEVEGSVTTLDDPTLQAGLAGSTPGDPTQVTLAEAPKPVPLPGEMAEAPPTAEPNPQVFAAREDETPEAPPTIEAQLSQFTDKARDVLRFENVDQVPDDLPKGVKEYEADDGTVWWYRGKTTARQIKKAIADKTENELLGLGPFNKEDVQADVNKGGVPLAVKAETPEGVEVAAAASTDNLAGPTIDAVQAANPGARVSVVEPREIIEGRENGTGAPTGRVLENISEAGRKAREEADREAARIAAENQRSMQQMEPAGRKRGADEVTAREHSNKTAEAIIGDHLPDDTAEQNFFDGRKPGASESRRAIMGRATQMAEAFRAAVKEFNDAVLAQNPDAKPDHLAKIPQAVRDNVQSTSDHNAAMLLVAEASRLARIKAPKSADFQRFVSREKALREGKREEVVAERRAEGDAALRKDQGDVEAPTGNIADALSTGAKHEIEDQVADQVDKELAASKGEIETDTSINENFETDLANARERKVELPGVGERGKKLLEKVSALAERGATEGERTAAKEAIERVKANAAASVVTAGKDKSAEVGTTIKVEKRRTFSKTKPKTEPVERAVQAARSTSRDTVPREKAEGFYAGLKPNETGSARTGKKTKAKRVSTLGAELRNVDIAGLGPLRNFIRKMLIDVVGHVKVHVVDSAELSGLLGEGETKGLYTNHPGQGPVVSIGHAQKGAERAHTLIHEAMHAVSHEVLNKSPEFKAAIRKIMKVFSDHLDNQFLDHTLADSPFHYAFKDEHEFLSEAWGNKSVHDELDAVELTPALAKELGVKEWRGKSLWSAAVEKFREGLRKLNIHWPADKVSALEAIMKITEEVTEERQFRDAMGVLGDERGELALSKDDLTRMGKRAKASLEAGVERAKRAVLFNTQLVRSARHLGDRFFKSADRANKIFKRMTAERQRILEQEGGADLVREAADLARAHPEAMREGADIANFAADLQVDPTPGAANDHIFTKDPSRGGEWWMARKHLPEIQTAWADFAKRHPEVADFLKRAAEWGRDAKNKQTREMVEKELDTAGLSDPALANRILKAGEVPDADKALFSSQVLVDHINRIVEANGRRGWYFPAIRQGDYVVTAKRAFDVTETSTVKRITTDENGEPVSNTVQFTDPTGGRSALKARRAAKDWVQNHTAKKIAGEREQLGTLGKPQQVWVDRNNPTKLLDKSDVDAIPAYRVRLQDEYMSLQESKADAAERYEQMQADGWDDVRNPDLKRLNPNANWGGMIPMQFEAFLNSLRDRGKFKNLNPGQQNEMIQALHQSSLKLHPGMRMQHHWVQRKNVMGAEKDIAQAISQFVTLDAGFRARLRYAGDLHEATREMHNVADNMNDKMNDRRRGVARELEERFYRGEEFKSQNVIDRAVSKLSQFSMVTKLAGPSQPIINSLEPSMVVLPVLAGYHGTVKAIRAMKDAYSAIGARGMLGAGLRDVVKAAARDHGFTDYREFIKDQLLNHHGAKSGGAPTANLVDLIDHLYDLNLFGHEAGMEVQRLTNAETNPVFRGVDRADLMFRQVNQAIEAINRAVTGIAAYELNYAKTKNHFEALDYAHDVVDETMGDYSASNSAPAFNSRAGRVALQFKKYGLKSYGLLGRLAADSFRGDREAIKAFAGVMVTHGVMAGAVGLPGMELVKAALFVPGLMGGYSWDDFQDSVRSIAESMLGKNAAMALTRGVPRVLGADASGRMGWENLALPRDNPRKPEDLGKWLGEAAGGAPLSLPIEAARTGAALLKGDLDAAMEAQSSKFLRDTYRAGKGLMTGFKDKTGRVKSEPYSIPEALVQVAGFKPGRLAEEQERNAAVSREGHDRDAKIRELKNNWINADAAGKQAALKAVQEFNATVPPNARILMKDLTSAAKRRRTEQTKGTYDHGMRVNKRNRDIVERAKEIY